MDTKTKHTIYSSHGEITTDEFGNVLEIDCCCTSSEECENCIDDIKKVDFDEWKKYHKTDELPNEFDILDVGLWRIDGEYEEPVAEHRFLAINQK